MNRYAYKFYFIAYLLFSLGINNTIKSQEWPTEKKNIYFEDTPLSIVLDSLSSIYKVNFSYNANIIGAYDHISLSESTTLQNVLQILFKGKNIEFSIIGKQVILYKVIDTEQGKPLKTIEKNEITIKGNISNTSNFVLPYASISLKGTGIATVANSFGEFVFRFPKNPNHDTIIISYIGYEPYFLLIDTISSEYYNIVLKEQPLEIKPVVVKVISASEIVRKAIANIHLNYSNKNSMYTAFYRETIHDGDDYISIVEAILDIAKSSYTSIFFNDQARVFKGHKSTNTKKIENLKFSVQGGVYNCLKIDLVKESSVFFSYEGLNQYDYKLIKNIVYNEYSLYVIDFEPKKFIDDLSYSGTLYIEHDTYALVAVKFQLTKQGLKYAQNLLIKKRPRKLSVKPIETNYLISYRKYNGKWHLDYTQLELKVKTKSNKWFINPVFTTVSQMVVTSIDTSNSSRFKYKDIVKSDDIIEEIVGYDDNYWDGYNIIQAEEPIIKAIQRISEKPN